MFFTMHVPQFPLSQFIESLWFVSGLTPYRREKVLPTRYIELMFNLGSPHKVYDDAKSDHFVLYKDSWISGLHTGYIAMETTAATNILGVRFKPGGAFPFFNLPISEFRDQIVDMDLIWGGAVAEIRERLFEAQGLAERFQILEQILMKRLKSNLYGLTAIQTALAELARIDQPVIIKDLSDQIGMSHKHLIDQFKKMVGLSPKQFARVLKFNQVLNTIDPKRPINWAAVAQQCHYYDQAHFNKDFMAFSGFTPGDYLRLRANFWNDTLLDAGGGANFVPIS